LYAFLTKKSLKVENKISYGGALPLAVSHQRTKAESCLPNSLKCQRHKSIRTVATD